MKLNRATHDPGQLLEFYEEGLSALGALCERRAALAVIAFTRQFVLESDRLLAILRLCSSYDATMISQPSCSYSTGQKYVRKP
jgi:hypothetical protein